MVAGKALPGTVEQLRVTRLAGRTEELAALDREAARALAGEFRVLLVEGGAGVGKTRLAADLLSRHDRETICLSARAYRWSATASFGLWVEALDRALRTTSESDRRRLCGPSLADLGFLLKSVEVLAPAAAVVPQRIRLLEAVADLLARWSQEHPVLVALDDVHLADASSWEMLHYLSRRCSGARMGIIMTARSEDLRGHATASEVLLSLAEDRRLHRLALQPLARGELAELAEDLLRAHGASGTTVPEQLVTWLLERSRGAPLFAIGLVRALLDEGADLTDPHLDRIPEDLVDRVRRDTRGLAADDHELLELLTVAGQRLEVGELTSVSGRSLEGLGAILGRLARSGLVAEHESGADLRYEVAHPLLQETIYADLGAARRRALHRRVGEALLASGRLAAAAGHVARGAEPGEVQAVEILCRAMRAAQDSGLFQEAIATLAALVDVLPAGDPRWLEVLTATDWQAEWVLGHLAEGEAEVALTAVERIAPLVAGTDDPRAQGMVELSRAAFLSFGAGRLEEAAAACRASIERFGAAGQTQLALLARNELAWVHGCAGDLADNVARSRQVLAEAEAVGSVRAAIHAAGSQGHALTLLGRFDEARQCLHRSIELAQQAGDDYRVAWGHNQLGYMLSLSGRLTEARASIETALASSASAPDTGSLEYLAHTCWLAGRLEDCVTTVERSEWRRSMSGSRRRAWALAVAARAHAEMGAHGHASRRAQRARATYQGRPFLVWACSCDWVDGILAWHNGDLRRALGALQRTCDWLAATGAAVYEALVLADLVEVAAEAGETTRTATAVRRLVDIAATVGGGLHPGLADLGAAHQHLAEHRLAEAAVDAGRAAERMSAGGYDLLAACAYELRGRALKPVDRTEAIATLQEASERYARCRAIWRRDRALGVLAGLGSSGRRAVAAVQGPEALTGRELEVARLTAQGYTAAEVGERLFIGKRTVESHLASIYAKLGIASKRELVRIAEDLDR